MSGASNFEMMLANFQKSAENIATYFDDEDDKERRDNLLEKLGVCVKTNCFQSLKSKKAVNSMKELSEYIDENISSEEAIELIKEKKKEILEYEPDLSHSTSYNEYCHQVKNLVDNVDGVKKKSAHEDEDIEMTQNDINIIDPFTKKRMTDPIKNKLCGHIYDRESLIQILKVNSKTRCPVVGCSNKNAIDLNDVIADIVTRKFLHDNP